jgi:hypothetical protein
MMRLRFAAVLTLLCVATSSSPVLAGPTGPGDGDGVFDVLDNCRDVPNAPPNDCDSDDDGYGNYCDGDFNQSNSVNATDFTLHFLPAFKTGTPSATGTDMNCSGNVNATDFTQRFLPQFKSGKPGPSGLHCAGTIPCDL